MPPRVSSSILCSSCKSFAFGTNVFANCSELTIYSRKGSAAQALAAVTGHAFEDIDSWAADVKLIGDTAVFQSSTSGLVRVPWFNAEENCPIRHTKQADRSMTTEIELPLFQEEVGNFEFSGCSNIKRVSSTGTIREIGIYAFQNCYALSEVPIDAGLESIGISAFENCIALKSVVLPESMTSIGGSAFNYCSNLETVELQGSFTVIPMNCFSYTNIKEITIPGSVVDIEYNSFNSCNALKTLILEEGVLRITSLAVNSCAALETVVLPSTLLELEGVAFGACTSLKDVWVYNPNTVFYTLQGYPSIYGGRPVIHGYPGSTAEYYAARWNLSFEAIGDE